MYELDENTKYCKRIAEELESYYNGEIYRCPDCGEEFEIDTEEEKHICPCCGKEIDLEEAEQVSLWDYFVSDIYNIEYRCDGSKEYRSVQLMIACGGPNIYIDTASGDVELYWWSERARWPIMKEIIEEIDYIFEEQFNCM